MPHSNALFREMADSAPAPVWASTANGPIEFVNLAFSEFAGLPREELLGDAWIGLIHPADVAAVGAARERARASPSPYSIEARFRDFRGEWRLLRATSRPRFDARRSFRGYVGMAADITEMRRAEERQHLLIDELNHRVKNTLATVLSLSSQSAKAAVSAQDYADRFQARVIALSRAHNTLTRTCWQGAALLEILETGLQPYADNVSLTGPDCALGNHAAESLSLIVHELATNAAKYGALSSGGGSVEVSWREDGGFVVLTWAETSKRPVAVPERSGFGTRLIQRLAAGDLQGDSHIDYRPGGILARVRFRPDWTTSAAGIMRA